MSALWPEEFVGHKWELNWRFRCGSAPDAVNAAGHLGRVGLGPGA